MDPLSNGDERGNAHQDLQIDAHARLSAAMARFLAGAAKLALLALGLHGCAVIDTRWDECEKGAGTFVAMAECTAREVQSDAARSSLPALRARSEARAQRYSQIVEELSEKVATGRIAEGEARIVLRHVLNDLLDAERDDRLTPLRQAPKTMTCSPSGGSVSCTQN